MTALSPETCRAARALLAWGQRDLSARSKVAQATITSFEIGTRQPYERTLEALRRAFEDAGVLFIDPVEGMHQGVAGLKWGAAPPTRQPGEGAVSSEAGEGGMKATWDDDEAAASLDALLCEAPGLNPDMAEMWRDDPELWARLSQGGRETLSTRMFGDCRAAAADFFGARG